MTIPAAKCPNCGCTEHEKRHNTITRKMTGRDPEGYLYTEVKWVRTACLECGQKIQFRTFRRPCSAERTE